MMRFLSTCVTLLILGPLCTTEARGQGQWTTLSGYHASQTNQCIRVSTSGRIDVIFSAWFDSSHSSRRTWYACSTTGGSWNSFGSLSVPGRNSSHPTLEVGRGFAAGDCIVANQAVTTGWTQSTAFVDDPGGGGAFAELSPPLAFGSDEPVDPFVACASDGSIVLLASRTTAQTCHITRTGDYVSWSPWLLVPGATQALGLAADSTGRVDAIVMGQDGDILLVESTNNGVSWGIPHEIVPALIVEGADSFATRNYCDLVFEGALPRVTFSLVQLANGVPSQKGAIGFWNGALGARIVVRHSSIPGIADSVVRYDGINYSLGQPAIGVQGSVLYLAFFAAKSPTAPAVETKGALFAIFSVNGGNSWSMPDPITFEPSADHTYPSLAKSSNRYGFCYVWQTRANTLIEAYAHQMFFGWNDAVDQRGAGLAPDFDLLQNYPNPFNPITEVGFRIGDGGFVSLKVFDLLGREVSTLVDKEMKPGAYSVTFDGSKLASGVYFYRLEAGSFVSVKRLLLLK